MATTQKALLVTRVGAPLVLVDNHPIPEPGPSQVQLKVTVAGLNPHDRKARDFGFFIADNLPAVLANDVVGRITKLGEGVTGLSVGDRVVSQAGLAPDSAQNGLQEYAVADVGALCKIPDCVADDEAAALPCNVVAPLVGLFGVLEIPAPWSPHAAQFDYASTTLLIVGGGSSCGQFAVQLARLANIGKIVVVGGDPAQLKGMGATHVVDRHGGHDAVLARIRAVVGDELVYAFDAASPPGDQALAVDALSGRKRGVMARLQGGKPVDESKITGSKTAGFEVRNVLGLSKIHPTIAGPFWERFPGYLETGKIKPLKYVVVKGLEADVVNEVLNRYRDGKSVTKTHVRI